MTLVMNDPAGTLKSAGLPQIPRSLLDVEHSSLPQAAFARNAVLATGSTRTRSIDQVGLLSLLGRCTSVFVL